jgi:hypothetical protein
VRVLSQEQILGRELSMRPSRRRDQAQKITGNAQDGSERDLAILPDRIPMHWASEVSAKCRDPACAPQKNQQILDNFRRPALLRTTGLAAWLPRRQSAR